LRDKVTFVGQVLDFELYDSDITSYSDREYDVYILVSGPLYDKKLFSCRMVRLARNLSHKYRTIVSMGDPDLEVSVLRGNLNVFGWVADTMMFLEKTRLVVLRGGQTSIFESILRGTPMLVIPPRGQTEQLENAYRVRMLGIGEYIDPSDSDDLGFIVGVINDIFDNYSFYIRNILRIRKFLLDCGGLNKAVMEIKKLIV
jgi:UDP:flavonoid glycosyltransferase YjiC (YdhE family)